MRKATILQTNNGSGTEPVVLDAETDEQLAVRGILTLQQYADMSNLGEIAILYRTNAASLVWERALRRAGLPFKVIGGLSFFARQEIKLSLSILKCLLNPRDSVSFLHACKDCCSGFGEKSLRSLSMATMKKKIPAEEAARQITNKAGLERFLTLLDEARTKRPEEALVFVLQGSPAWLAMQKDSTPDNDRCENVRILCEDVANMNQDISEYLQQVALTSASDLESNPNAINLMTIHASKGLEFETVFVSHLVDGLLPHNLSLADYNARAALEEERRLLYVAMTRAKNVLILGYFKFRHYNKFKPSRFLSEIF
jgi:DNA helicase-2/ATP-dependent DNA helicase PcrA